MTGLRTLLFFTLLTVFLVALATAQPTLLSVGKSATASGEINWCPPNRSPCLATLATDGNTDQRNDLGPGCAQTNSGDGQFVKVDLGQYAAISSIVLYSRNDSCCAGRVTTGGGTSVWVSDVAGGNAIDAELVTTITSRTSNNVFAFNVSRTARYVEVRHAGNDGINLCELQVWGTFVPDPCASATLGCQNGGSCTVNFQGAAVCTCPQLNAGPTCQYSPISLLPNTAASCVTLPDGSPDADGWCGDTHKEACVPSYAIDGNLFMKVDVGGACYHSQGPAGQHWLRVTLNGLYHLLQVTWLSRDDCPSCVQRPVGTSLWASNNAVAFSKGTDAVQLSIVAQTTPTRIYVFPITQTIYTRAVELRRQSEYLEVCELLVFGTPVTPDPCTNYCQNGGTCTSSLYDTTTVSCACPSSYIGTTCTQTTSCTTTTCKNGGLCTPIGTSSFSCACVSPYAGATCTEIGPCASNPCLNGGVCSSNAQGYTCQCPFQWTGAGSPNCGAALSVAYNKTASQTDTGNWCAGNGSPCSASYAVDNVLDQQMDSANSYCAHTGGTAPRFWRVDLGTTYSITKVMLYNRLMYANRLQTATLWVANLPTPRNDKSKQFGSIATTSEESQIYTFNLNPALVAQYVEVRKEAGDDLQICEFMVFGSSVPVPCAASPCVHGTCYNDYTGVFSCVCDDTWAGPKCDHESPCNANPCKHFGTCTSADGLTYSCKCPIGWTGQQCDTANPDYVTVQVGVKATASDNDLHPEYIVDGVEMQSVAAGALCFLSGAQKGKHWLRVDLNAWYALSSVVVYGRTDACCASYLNGLSVVATHSATPLDPTARLITRFTSTSASGVYTLALTPAVRTRVLELRSEDSYLQLCELLASGAPTTESCASTPCQNAGVCSEKFDTVGYTCTCTAGYMGDTCGEVSGCGSFPCLNGGACQPLAGGAYKCNCGSMFDGDVCQNGPLSIAYKKTTDMSDVGNWCGLSSNSLCSPDYSVDGDLTQFMSDGTHICAHSSSQAAWWHVDLVDAYIIMQVVIYLRQDSPCCANRAPGNSVWLTFSKAGNAADPIARQIGYVDAQTDSNIFTYNLPASPVSIARYIEVRATNFIQLCELTAKGTKTTPQTCQVGNPCQHSGVCQQLTNGSYACDCVAPWGGKDCSFNNPCPTTNPCQNGGTCLPNSDFSSGWHCACLDVYTGAQCDSGPQSITFHKTTSSSGVGDWCLGSGAPCSDAYAVDGIYAQSMDAGAGCFHSSGNNPWFRVDLGQRFIITEVVWYHRTDTCGGCRERVLTSTLWVTNAATPLSADAYQFGQVSAMTTSQIYTFTVGVLGRYLEVRRASDILQICELTARGTPATGADPCANTPCQNGGTCSSYALVNGAPAFNCTCTSLFTGATCSAASGCTSNPCQNGGTCSPTDGGGYTCKCWQNWDGLMCDHGLSIAYQKNASLSSTDQWCGATESEPCYAWYGVDGRAYQSKAHGTFVAHSVTGNGAQNWWRVDLGSLYALTQLKVYHRFDCCPERMVGVQLWVSNSPLPVQPADSQTKQVAVVTASVPSAVTTHAIDPPLEAQFVEMRQYTALLNLEEMLVSGTPVTAPCAATPCLNGGVCTNTLTHTYTCACQPQYVGSRCETVNQQCQAAPCHNGGTCVASSATAYTCRCLGVFSGPTCDVGPTSIAYHKNATASDAAYLCGPQQNELCVPALGVDGDTAQKVETGARCFISQSPGSHWYRVDLGGLFQVTKVSLYYRADACCRDTAVRASLWLDNSPTALSTSAQRIRDVVGLAADNVYSIQPPSSLFSRFVEVRSETASGKALHVCELVVEGTPAVSVCASSPCLNNGECTPNLANTAFTCLCGNGYSGARCETPTACATKPCLNGGVCSVVAGTSGYTCACTVAYTGTTCAQPTACAAVSCKNGGACALNPASPNGWECKCASIVYEGRYCEVGPTSISTFKSASMSNVGNDCGTNKVACQATFAVDGVVTQSGASAMCAETQIDRGNNWWRVALVGPREPATRAYQISSVYIYQRSDNNWYSVLAGSSLYFSNSLTAAASEGPSVTKVYDVPSGNAFRRSNNDQYNYTDFPAAAKLRPMRFFELRHYGHISVCEVLVFGTASYRTLRVQTSVSCPAAGACTVDAANAQLLAAHVPLVVDTWTPAAPSSASPLTLVCTAATVGDCATAITASALNASLWGPLKLTTRSAPAYECSPDSNQFGAAICVQDNPGGNSGGGDNALSGGAVAGIVVGSITALVLAMALAYLFCTGRAGGQSRGGTTRKRARRANGSLSGSRTGSRTNPLMTELPTVTSPSGLSTATPVPPPLPQMPPATTTPGAGHSMYAAPSL